MPKVATGGGNAKRVELAVQHPECWVIEVSEQANVGLLGRGVYETSSGRANSHVTVFADKQASVSEAIEVARASPHTFSVAEMTAGPHQLVSTAPGNASTELLIEHDPSKQVSQAFLSRGFVYAAPVNIRDGTEHWTLFTHQDRSVIQWALDKVRDSESAAIDLIGITETGNLAGEGTLPLSQLSPRQREIFQLARRRGYYKQPKTVTAGNLAAELDITTSTLHEHLHRAEEKLLDLS
jgi:predicted DNA binding protein